jgi:hypothetical protein
VQATPLASSVADTERMHRPGRFPLRIHCRAPGCPAGAAASVRLAPPPLKRHHHSCGRTCCKQLGTVKKQAQAASARSTSGMLAELSTNIARRDATAAGRSSSPCGSAVHAACISSMAFANRRRVVGAPARRRAAVRNAGSQTSASAASTRSATAWTAGSMAESVSDSSRVWN